ncbi:hypothetical protein [endosymbiont GvMRE of Glomus versiforme]|uniref:hypothetical protein n=1 Tax=endosymbiont GvMRE of Glomus versiforme TaxID=2039283 RepID=UPI000EEF1225|nr:hypothetical protein [endosymbiont GvMRE of Glomus versiforme]RHZ37180.1 hypothetical protein GvMRE_I1g279 [endosymbiont GvMRE of Glomus versiforme]
MEEQVKKAFTIKHKGQNGIRKFKAIFYREKYKECEDHGHWWFSLNKIIAMNVNGKNLCPQHAKWWLDSIKSFGKVIKGNIKGLIEALKAELNYYE